jgi:hypothetical protein
MTTGVIETKGTRLYFNSAEGSPSSILKVACATGITGLGGPADQIDITCLDSEEAESRPGFKRPAVVSVPINFIPRSAAHQALLDLEESGDTVDWMIVFSDQDGAPTTLDGDGNLVSPGATSVRFNGYVQDFNIDVATNEIVRATLSIQRSGAKEWDLPAADLP